MYGKWQIFVFILVFIFGIVVGNISSSLFHRADSRTLRGESRELQHHLEQVNRDLAAALYSQRESAERAFRLQTELAFITEYARNLEEGTGRTALRAGNITERLDGIIEQSIDLFIGIDRAYNSLEDSRILIGELGTIILKLQDSGGREDFYP